MNPILRTGTRGRPEAIAVMALVLAALGAAPRALADPPPGSRWQRLPALSDEFNGTALDTAKWWPDNPEWQGRSPGYFSTKNVRVRDGSLQITTKQEKPPGLPPGYTYTCGAVQSKTKVLYGYFEARCQPMNSHGSSAFWFYDNTPDWWTEIDVFEIGGGAPGHEKAVHMNAHVFHTPTDKEHHSEGGDWNAPFKLADGYHVYALEWSKDTLRYYVDGKVVRSLPNTYWHQPLTLNFDSETMPDWFGLPQAGELPSTFRIDYVRSWQKVGKP